MNESTDLIAVRHNQHGDWMVQAKLASRLKHQMELSANWSMLEAHQREALEMIAVKISRILSGNAAFEDHWDDIGGYALLGKGTSVEV